MNTAISIENVDDSKHSEQVQKLFAAVKLGEVETVENLLEQWEKSQQPEEINDLSLVRNEVGNSILHLAIECCQPSIVNILMRDGRINPSVKNKLGRTPLHLFHCEKRNECPCTDHKCLDALLSFDSTLNKEVLDAQDNDGNCALHYAARYKCAYCIQSLIRAGASFNIKSNSTTFPFVTPRIFNQYPWAGSCLESKMNKGVSLEKVQGNYAANEDFEGSDFRILMDFSSIVPQSNVNGQEAGKEMEFLETILSANRLDQKKIFSHPLVSSFVFMKWERVKRIFILSLIMHIALAVVYTTYITTVYLRNCPYSPMQNSTSQGERNCDKGWGSLGYSISLLVVAGILGLLEIIKMLQNPSLYINTYSNYFQWIMILCMWMTVFPVKWNPHGTLLNWQYSAAAYGIFHVWATLMINMGRFPKLGIYVEMFAKVLQNFGFFLLAYIFLILAFSISFCVIFPDYPPFKSIPRAILKVITMMSGEVDYGDFFYGDHTGKETGNFIFDKNSDNDLLHPITGHILYGAFVVLVTIVLTNLLIGLAVDDIKGLQQNAGFTKTTREVASIAYIESLVFWNKIQNVKCIPWLRRFIFLGRLDKKISSQPVRFYIDELVSFLKAKIFSPKAAIQSNDRKSRRQSDKTLPKYTFGISHEDCKSPRLFPEDALLKAVEMANKENTDKPPTQIKGLKSVFNNQHCPTCQCDTTSYSSL